MSHKIKRVKNVEQGIFEVDFVDPEGNVSKLDMTVPQLEKMIESLDTHIVAYSEYVEGIKKRYIELLKAMKAEAKKKPKAKKKEDK